MISPQIYLHNNIYRIQNTIDTEHIYNIRTITYKCTCVHLQGKYFDIIIDMTNVLFRN